MIKLDIRQKFFSHRVIDTWNGVGNSIVNCKTVTTFKAHLEVVS